MKSKNEKRVELVGMTEKAQMIMICEAHIDCMQCHGIRQFQSHALSFIDNSKENSLPKFSATADIHLEHKG